MFNILVVEDDQELRELFCTVLSENGYHPLEAEDGAAALAVLDKEYVDLIISDIMMPNIDGYTLTRDLRAANYTMPILMITAKDGANYKQACFRAGIDDYMVKPIDVNEMIWRVEALLRRSKIISERRLKIGDTVFDYDALTVSTPQQTGEILPQKEFYLIYKLASSPNRIFTRRQLMDEIWGMDTETDSHTLDVHINRLRERFRNNPDFEIATVRGLGYKVVLK